jgi:hypothetical protein
LNNALERGTATTSRTGIGQRYQSFLEEFADNIVVGEGNNRKTLKTKDLLNNVSKALGEYGATQKVDTLKKLNDQLSIISDKNSKKQNMTKEVNQIQSLTQKFNKGGLASRR